MREKVQKIAQLLMEKKASVSTAESCTGGLLGARITDLPGSSAFYEGGIISYSNKIKEEQLSVPSAMLKEYGAVSEEVASSMAEGIRETFHTTYGLSTTGIAGPDGGSEKKPVGLVFSAIAGPKGVKIFKDIYTGTREEVRRSTVSTLLDRFSRQLEEEHI